MAIDVDFRFVRAGIKISSLSTLLFAFSAQLAALAQSLFRRVRARPSPFPALLSPCLRALPTSSSLSATHNTGILAQPQPQSPFAPRINRSRHLASRLHRLIVLIAPAFENHELCTKSPDRALSNRAIVHKNSKSNPTATPANRRVLRHTDPLRLSQPNSSSSSSANGQIEGEDCNISRSVPQTISIGPIACVYRVRGLAPETNESETSLGPRARARAPESEE